MQHLAHAWYPGGTPSSRQDLRAGLSETFGYDADDRLTSISGPGGTLTMAYDESGNLTSRSDVGTYTYHAIKKHAVIAAGSNTYDYDANGNVTKRNGSIVRWTSYNLPSMINMGNFYAAFTYAPDRRRLRQVSPYATGKEITIYVGEQLEKLTTPARTHWKHRLPTPSGEVQVIRRSDGTTETLYLASDHLGSVDAVLNASGAVLARPSFNAWGGRRGSNWQGAPSQSEWQAIADTTRRGYTGHEQLDNVMLVHMNGRVYDPGVGRFLSADPFVDGMGNPQGWNRYGYVQNRPLSYSDASGWSTETVVVTGRRYRDGPSYNGGSLGMGVVGSGGGGEPVEATVVVEASRLPPESPPEPPAPPKPLPIPSGPAGLGGCSDGGLAWPVPDHFDLNKADKRGEGLPEFHTPRGRSLHAGIDIAGPIGTPVVAAANGTVVRADGRDRMGYGNQIVIGHEGGVYTQYGHLQAMDVAVDDAVSAMQRIGTVGLTGNSPGDPHLHFEVRIDSPLAPSRGGVVADPMRFFGQECH